MKKIFTKVKDYFTANACRKVFFLGTVLALVMLILFWATGLIAAFIWVATVSALVALIASMVDSMQARTAFIRQVKAMQYDHLQTIYQQQQAGQAVAVTPTFSPEEKKYIKRKKWEFVLAIILKLAFCLVFISLLAAYM